MSEVSRCPVCGAFVHAQDPFCWSCGADLAAPELGLPVRRPVPELDEWIALLLRRAHLAQQRGQFDRAERLVREAIARDATNVPALSMLAEILRAKGDEVGAVEAAQIATEQAAIHGAPPGALRHARQDRAEIEEEVVRSLLDRRASLGHRLLDLFTTPGPAWNSSRLLFAGLAALGLAALFCALVAVLLGHVVGYLWIVFSILAAGWSYRRAERQGDSGPLWGLIVVCLGPFGLLIRFLAGR